MLDGILGKGFASKCKSLIKMTKSRIDVIRRKRNATLKFLKKDIADLLSNGLDINAYGRAEGLLAELTLSSCYDYVEKSGDFVLTHLSVMQKMRHCPEDCREAVSSLMFAAARFSDLPELRELRDAFHERYGTSVELFANQEFIEHLSSKPFTEERKIQLMHDIAAEFGIAWDSKAFKRRASKDSKHTASPQEQPRFFGSPYTRDDKYKPVNGNDAIPKVKHDILPKEGFDRASGGYKLMNGKESNISKGDGLRYEDPSKRYKPHNVKEERILKRDVHDYLFQGRQEIGVGKHEAWEEDASTKTVRNGINSQSRNEVLSNGYKPLNVKEEPILQQDYRDRLFQGKEEVAVKHESWKEDTPRTTVRLGSSSQRKRLENVDGGSYMHDCRENTVPKGGDQATLIHGKPEIVSSYGGLWSKVKGNDPEVVNHHRTHGSQYSGANSVKDVREESYKLNSKCNNALPPPYTKPNSKFKDGKLGVNLGSSMTEIGFNAVPEDSSRDNQVSDGSNGSEKIRQEAYYFDHRRQNARSLRANHGHEDDGTDKDGGISNPIPKPRSSRQKYSKSHASQDDDGNLEDTGVAKRRSRSRRRGDSRRGLQVLFDDEHYRNDEEEKIIDKLLIHYSKKPSACEPEKVRRKSRSHHADHLGVEGKSQHISKDRADEISEMLPPPRSISLPREQNGPSEATKVFARAASFQPDRSTPAKHVHPKLPDYDDLAARFAALKGR